MKFVVVREPVIRPASGEAFTPGRLFADGLLLGWTCEDEDRALETVGVKEKIHGRSGIPRGTFTLENSFSTRFQRTLPAVLGVAGFSGVRIHGGNRAEDSMGCILVGQVRTATGIAQCANTVRRVIALIAEVNRRGELCWLEVA